MAENQLSLLLFEVEGKKLLININDLVEIIPIQGITRLPKSAKSITGLTNYRGEVIGILDAAEILSISKKNKGHTRIIVVKYKNDKFGIPANRIHEVIYPVKGAVKGNKIQVNGEEVHVIGLGDLKI